MAKKPSFSDRFAEGFGEAVADIRSALVERAWFGYEEISRSNNSHFYGAPYVDRSVEGPVPAELIETEWFRSNREGLSPQQPSPHDLGHELQSERERDPNRDQPGIDIDF